MKKFREVRAWINSAFRIEEKRSAAKRNGSAGRGTVRHEARSLHEGGVRRGRLVKEHSKDQTRERGPALTTRKPKVKEAMKRVENKLSFSR